VLLDELLSRRLVILSGKGGVGKSVLGLALAVAARDRGKRALLVEIDTAFEASRLVGQGPVGSSEREILPGLFSVNLKPTEVMDEYVSRTVPIDLMARRILGSPIYRRFFAAAPGLADLIVLGKILVLEEAREGRPRRPRYDLIVVDAPATGHGLAFLKVPGAASAAIPVGPVGNNGRRIVTLLRDSARTCLVIVAIPEEMAVAEAVDFHRLALEDLKIKPTAVLLNACHERRFTPDQEATLLRLGAMNPTGRLAGGVAIRSALAAARRHIRRAKLTRFYLARLRKALPTPVFTLPYIYREELGLDSIQLLADRLGAS